MTTSSRPQGAVLVGSVPFASADDVFRQVGALLGPWLRRLPDGETGERTNWIRWQRERLAQLPQVQPTEERTLYAIPRFGLRPGTVAADIELGVLGYARAATDSFAGFARLQEAGELPAHLRFQVCLPTPLAPVSATLQPEAQAIIEPLYEARLLDELQQLLATVPHAQLAVQWDVAMEFAILEGLTSVYFADVQPGISERLVRLGNQVPADVELGYHLCYGSFGNRHFKEPSDTGLMVAVANAVLAGLQRPLSWLHLPVPQDRVDAAYFAPLRALQVPSETELYLGLVHSEDGVAGTERRIAAAQQVVARFGVAAECGFGRAPVAEVPDLLRLHAAVAEPVIPAA